MRFAKVLGILGNVSKILRSQQNIETDKIQALTTPKIPIPEPIVVIVGIISNFPAWINRGKRKFKDVGKRRCEYSSYY